MRITYHIILRCQRQRLNADRTECWLPKTAVCGRNANPNHTAITITWQHDMVVNPVGRHSGHSAFRHRSNIAATNFQIYIEMATLPVFSNYLFVEIF